MIFFSISSLRVDEEISGILPSVNFLISKFFISNWFANNEASVKSSDISSDTIDILSASEKSDLYMLWEHMEYKGRISHLLSHCFTKS